ncbi:phosphonate C-P lyase system protein PhnH [Afipia clevelandensis]|uniref:Phosphonate C-P lyase system protein PhnH n=1 Tax=Afipia clevelandensis ATCC 49720 TaxID=883079 RepID=K8PL82_9BRAD|nr:phosphonate C-P lyase system protein PhnH [Afipia clevelandensis]EKS42336.1 phosphonate C-P lyase system protein PhnH [Afipia clevelandensis ATCC 49720]
MTSLPASDKSATQFAESVLASQSVFRSVMNALARPGAIQTISALIERPQLLMPATAAVALALFDHDTPVWADAAFCAEPEIANWLRFQTGAPLVAAASAAAFALVSCASALLDFEHFAQGTPEYPDRSATLIVQADTLTEGPELILSGPGIQGTSSLRAGALPPDFAKRMQANGALFPQGVDLLLVCGAELVALPRSTHVAAKEA